MTQPTLRISVSALTRYWTCGEAYKKIYVTKELKRSPPTQEMVCGTAVHAGVDVAYKAKIAGETASVAAMMLAADKAINEEAGKIKVDIIDAITDPNGRANVIRERAYRAIAVCHKELIPNVSPIESEYEIGIEWRPGVRLVGYIDCVSLSDDGRVHIRDLKVGGPRTPDPFSAERSDQLAIYAIAYRKQAGIVATHGILDHYVDSKRPHFTPREVVFTERRLNAVRKKVDVTVDAILAGVFPPGDPYWTCNKDRCDFHARCEMGAGLEVVVDE